MRNFKIFFIVFFLAVTAFAWKQTKAEEVKEIEKDAQVVSPESGMMRLHYNYAGNYSGEALPPGDSNLTREQLDRLMQNGHYNWMGVFFTPTVIDPQAYSVKSLVDKLGNSLLESLYLSEVLALKIEREDCDQQKGKISLETDRVATAVMQNIRKASKISVDDTLSVTNVPSRIESIEGYVSGLWLEHHGFKGVTVEIYLNNLSQKWEMYRLGENEVIEDFQYVVSIGNMGGAQTKDMIKVYTVAYDKDSASYTVLFCPDVEASPVKKNGRREIELLPFFRNVRGDSLKSILSNMPFNLTDNCIARLFAPNPLINDVQTNVVSTVSSVVSQQPLQPEQISTTNGGSR